MKCWIKDQSGATAIEYSLICAGVALAVSVFIFQFGEEMYSFFSIMIEALDG